MHTPKPHRTVDLNRRQWLSLAALAALASLRPGVAVGVTPANSNSQDNTRADNQTDTWTAVRQRWAPDTWLLLGEVHDNVAQHRLRHELIQAQLKNGWRPALLMEQFDREHQGAIDAAVRPPGASARSVVDAAGGTGSWDWPLYLPFIDLALQHGLRIVAVNVSRADARRVMADGLKAHGFDEAIPEDVRRALGQDILASHCGAIPEQVAQRMVLAQVARDQFMARMLVQHGGQGAHHTQDSQRAQGAPGAPGAVLLAGNGHVRKDFGVPRWLPPETGPRTLSVGLLEAGDTQRGAYDEVIVTAPQDRPNPCADFKAPAVPQPAPQPAASSRP